MEVLIKSSGEKSSYLGLAIGLFLLLDLTILTANFWLSAQISRDAVAINLAGRQRMLSQRIVKALLQLKHAPDARIRDSALAELIISFDRFDNTLNGFIEGGTVTGGHGNLLQIEPLSDPGHVRLVIQAEDVWVPYRDAIKNLLDHAGQIPEAIIANAIDHALDRNIRLLTLMNDLTTEMESSALQKSDRIRLFQTIAFVLALINFATIIVIMRRDLHSASKNLGTLKEITNNIEAGIIISDASGQVRAANQHAGSLFGYDPAQMINLSRQQLLFLREGILYGQRQDGSIFYASSQQREFKVEEDVVSLETITDVTLQHTVAERLNQLAYYDALTSLPNRLLFEDRLQQGILSAKRRHSRLAVMFIDLDGFKQVNDLHGHHIGDNLLKEVAVRLRQNLREEDTVSRLGGDEFTVILNSMAGIEDCERIVQNLLQSLNSPFMTEGILLRPEASIGLSLYPDDGADGKTLIEKSDQAMYKAKRQKSNHYAFY
jgi:diguanylate cyclase (GGDEF)-like protein